MIRSEKLERDPLTGVYTRASLGDTLWRETALPLEVDRQVSLLVLDLDYLKSINDGFGHRRGDEVLIELVARIDVITRDTDQVFRTGGDEFVLVLPGTDKREATEIARRVLEGVRSQQFAGEPPLTVSLSIGVATLPDDTADPEELLHIADLRAYDAKRRGRGRVVSDESVASPAHLFAGDTSGRLVERDFALETLNRWLEGLEEQRRGTLSLSGAGGSGRSRFLEEVPKVARLRGYMVLTAGTDNGAGSLGESLVAQLPEDTTGRSTGKDTPDMLVQALAEAISGDRYTGVLFVVDSIATLDDAEMMLLRHLSDGMAAGKVGLVYSGEIPPGGEAMLTGGLKETIHLQGLSIQGLLVWVRSLLQWEYPPAFLDWLYRETGGLPGHVRRGLEYLVEKGIIRQSGQSWVLAGDISEISLSDELGLEPEKAGTRHNLPAIHYGFVGRNRETEEVRRLLGEARLVTVTGPGGIGKTHLAVHTASVMLDQFKNGVSFVPLAALRDPESVALTLAQALEVAEAGSKSPLEAVKARLRDAEMLLVMDNFEQVIDAAQLVADLLVACPHVRVLATSREVLHVRWERVFELPPLAVPATELLAREGGARVFEGFPAVAMFVQCAQGSRPDFSLTDENATAVAGICARLDGLPLAIELVAARVKILSAWEILARLKSSADQEALRLLSGGPRDMPDRHRTMRAAIGWSYDLLSDREKVAFRWLGVFAGGFTLDAAAAVLGGYITGQSGRVTDWQVDQDPAERVFGDTSSLLDKSLLKRVGGAEEEARFAMLETIREYALEKLAESGEAWEAGRGHAAYYLAIAERAEPALVGPEQKRWLSVLVSEYDNMRAALMWAQGAGEWETLAQMASLLWRLWYLQGPVREGRGWLDVALAHREEISPIVQAKVLQGAGVLSRSQGEFATAEKYLLDGLGVWRELGDNFGTSITLNSLGLMAIEQGLYGEAQTYLEESARLDREMGLKQRVAVSLNNLGGVAYFLNDYQEATRFYTESLQIRREMDDKWGIANSLYNMGEVAQHEEDYARAGRLYSESLALRRELGDKRGVCPCFDGLAAIAAALGQCERAATLLGAADALRESTGAPRTAIAQTEYKQVVAEAQGQMAAADYSSARRAGNRMASSEAVAYALHE